MQALKGVVHQVQPLFDSLLRLREIRGGRFVLHHSPAFL